MTRALLAALLLWPCMASAEGWKFGEEITVNGRQLSKIIDNVTVDNNVTTSSATPTDITGLSYSLIAGKEYGFMCVLGHLGTATSAPRFVFQGPAVTSYVERWRRATTATADTISTATALNTQTAACTSSCNATALSSTVSGIIMPSANGVFKLQVASSTAGQTVTVYRGSFCVVR